MKNAASGAGLSFRFISCGGWPENTTLLSLSTAGHSGFSGKAARHDTYTSAAPDSQVRYPNRLNVSVAFRLY